MKTRWQELKTDSQGHEVGKGARGAQAVGRRELVQRWRAFQNVDLHMFILKCL